ncbi:group II intron maturase-specific domain-containing protein [Acetobacterium sp.]|uniref:group II intron maturase-specific domain-containing protein n=1 Tax=Acetobacterium sp. TaxID=1872094 RepID=UPI0035936EC5
MLENIPTEKDVLKKFLKAGYLFEGKLFPTTEGSAQGGIISPTIANMVLDGMEDAIAQKFWPSKKGRNEVKDTHRNGVNVIRYADDFIITAYSETTAREIIKVIEEFLSIRGLVLSSTKTKITTIHQGFDFLGWNFRKYSGKLIVKPSLKSTQKLVSTLSQEIKNGTSSAQSQLIRRLNQILRGWTNYHQPVCAKETFGKIDHVLWEMLYHWAKRRHRNKSKQWIIRKYWCEIGTRKWLFKDEGAT